MFKNKEGIKKKNMAFKSLSKFYVAKKLQSISNPNKLDFLKEIFYSVQFSSITQSCPTLCDPRQASLSITNSQSSPKPMSIESVMPSNYLILCCPLLLQSSIFPSIRIFSNESAVQVRWPENWSFNFNISPSNEHPGLISFRMD